MQIDLYAIHKYIDKYPFLCSATLERGEEVPWEQHCFSTYMATMTPDYYGL